MTLLAQLQSDAWWPVASCKRILFPNTVWHRLCLEAREMQVMRNDNLNTAV